MHFSVHEQEKIRENMFTEGLQLLKEYGVQRMTVDKPVSYTHLTLPTNWTV